MELVAYIKFFNVKFFILMWLEIINDFVNYLSENWVAVVPSVVTILLAVTNIYFNIRLQNKINEVQVKLTKVKPLNEAKIAALTKLYSSLAICRNSINEFVANKGPEWKDMESEIALNAIKNLNSARIKLEKNYILLDDSVAKMIISFLKDSENTINSMRTAQAKANTSDQETISQGRSEWIEIYSEYGLRSMSVLNSIKQEFNEIMNG